MTRWILTAAALLTALLTPAFGPAEAATRALLVGIGDYPGMKQDEQLEGPPHDVAALRALLTIDHGVPGENIVTRVDGAATRKEILDALDRLVDAAEAGDFIFFYFSGHGTSAHGNPRLSLDLHTGAIYPHDYKRGTPEEIRNRLIIGSRDIRPRLKALDGKGALALVSFDACFSGYAVRSLRGREGRRSRYVPLPIDSLTDGPTGDYGEQTAEAPPYPYRNVVYISGSSPDELADDISQGRIWSGTSTVDGKPHGAMTDALLRALGGGADTDGNGEITLKEIYQYVKVTTSERFTQTPLLLFNEDHREVLDRPVFRSAGPVPPPPTPDADAPLRVKLEGDAAELKDRIEGINGLTLTEDDFDILVTHQRAGKRSVRRTLYLYLDSGALLAQVAAGEIGPYLERQVDARKLIRFRYDNQPFNVSLTVTPEGGVFREGSPIGFVIESDADAYILLINIDSGGHVNVIYPYFQREMEPVSAGEPLEIPDCAKVVPPHFGTEYMKVIAFGKRPSDFAQVLKCEVSADDPKVRAIAAMIRRAAGDAAQMTLPIKTVPAEDIVRVDGGS